MSDIQLQGRGAAFEDATRGTSSSELRWSVTTTQLRSDARKKSIWLGIRGCLMNSNRVDFLLCRGYLHCGAHSLICSRLCACPSAHLSGAQAMCQPRRVYADTRSCARVLHMDTYAHMSSSQDALAAVLTPRPRPVSSLIHNKQRCSNARHWSAHPESPGWSYLRLAHWTIDESNHINGNLLTSCFNLHKPNVTWRSMCGTVSA